MKKVIYLFVIIFLVSCVSTNEKDKPIVKDTLPYNSYNFDISWENRQYIFYRYSGGSNIPIGALKNKENGSLITYPNFLIDDTTHGVIVNHFYNNSHTILHFNYYKNNKIDSFDLGVFVPEFSIYTDTFYFENKVLKIKFNKNISEIDSSFENKTLSLNLH